jgi:DNA invertase Pin-like site-specific DNA recombinase
MDTLDAYIRVSATKGRKGGGLGADEQRQKVAAWAALKAGEVDLEWPEPDLDQTGGKMSRPTLDRIMERIERGESQGIVVAKLNRLSRASLKDALGIIERVHAAGAKLVSVEEGIDPTTPYGGFAMNVLLSLAEMQRLILKDQLDYAKERAREDGAHVAEAPFGTMKSDGYRSPIVPDPETAPLVRECFIRRGTHASWMSMVHYLEERGHRVAKSSVGYMLRNHVYVDVGIVTQDEFDAAQVKGREFAKNGTLASQGVVSGLITCSACGHRLALKRTGARQDDGKRAPSYGCTGHTSADGKCPAPASASLSAVDDFVEEAISTALVEGTLRTTVDAAERYARVVRARDRAQEALDGIKAKSVELTTQLGVDGFAQVVADHRAALDEAKAALRETPKPDDTIMPDTHWGTDLWTIEEKRRLARQLIEEVTLERSGKGRWGRPIHERVRIRWAGHDDFDSAVHARGAEARETAARLSAAD